MERSTVNNAVIMIFYIVYSYGIVYLFLMQNNYTIIPLRVYTKLFPVFVKITSLSLGGLN